jgi:intein/homing endonuclease
MDNQQGNLHWSECLMDSLVKPLAYSIGALLGDGSVKTRVCRRDNGNLQEAHVVTISNMDIECIHRVTSEVNKFFGTEYIPHSKKNINNTSMFYVNMGTSLIYHAFHYFIQEKLSIPDEIFRSDREDRLNFLAGLFDTDGYIAEQTHPGAKYGLSWRVGYAARFRTLVEDVTRLLQKLGVKVGTIHEQISGHGTVMYVIKPNIKSFVEADCYFHIQRKQKRLQNYVRRVLGRSVEPSETIMPDLLVRS